MSTVTETRAAIEGEDFSRVAFTSDALQLLRKLWGIHGQLMFHQSGGCCDGSSPMCYPAGEFRTGGSDILLGVLALDDAEGAALGEIEFWMSKEQFEYWKHTKLTVDVVNGRGSGFSVEAPEGKRFLIRSEIIEFPAG
ncbi:DUF779 domain-containing protein [Glutamicibacter nicotianae]|jgi:uncharacterized protein (DUF779 family)|uniref:DUF779 domain-containing protein n=1 Tax=Glutamicibacter nicotianae TaxID=37929 RepID=UPI001958EA12|nr:DUF779 domain-containing protein [Glutamicibacter nicotianae]MBM7767018.1 uncharacterized protein (DUF779 family) [Glutamicibacter nicotianae]